MLPVQRDQVSPEDEIVADKYTKSGADLDRHSLVVRGSQTQSGDAVLGVLVDKLQDAKQGRAIAPQRILFFSNKDLVQAQNFVQGVDELNMRYGFERTGCGRCLHQSQLFSGDKIRIHVRQKLAVLHFFSL